MNRKCKICGYIFKDDDEVICPECLTAREEDISCDSFSHDDHCDDSYSHFKAQESKPKYFDETFDDDNSFIEDEIKDEQNDEFAKAEQKQADSVNMGNTTGTYEQKSQTGPVYIKTKFNYTTPANQGVKQNAAKKNNLGKIIVVTFVVMWFLPIVFSIILGGINSNSHESSEFDDYEKELKSLILSDDGLSADYSIEFYSLTDYDDSSENEQIIYTVGEVSKMKNAELYIELNDEDDENPDAVITSIVCSSVNKNNISNMASLAEEKVKTYVDEANSYVFLVDDNADSLDFKIYYTIDGENKDIEFTYDIPEE